MLWPPDVLMVKFDGLAPPLSVQANVSGSELASVALAVRASVPVTPTTPPVAAGICDAHTGGVFLTTVHVCVTVLEPLLTEATKVLLPVLKLEEAICFVFAAPVKALPLSDQLTAQLGSPGVTVKVLLVAAAAEIRGVADVGDTLAIEQAGNTFTVHEH
jgi:hypothetical protein